MRKLVAGLRVPVVTVASGLLVCSLLLILAGASPLEALGQMIDGAFGGRYEIGETLVRAVPIALVALSALPALRAGVFTVGSEGSFAAGAIGATAAVLAVRYASGPVLVLVGAAGGILGGTLWALLPAVLRSRLGVNEILSTLLMNYLASGLLLWSLRTWLATPEPVATPRSERLPDAARLGALVDGTRLHVGALLVVVAAAVLVWWVRSARGLLVDVYAARPSLAVRLGVDEPRLLLYTMLLAGAGAGVAGWMQVAGVQGTLYPSVAGGLGFTGVLVALLGDLRPVAVVGAAVIYAALVTGGEGVQQGTGVPSSIATVLQGLLLIAAALAFADRQRRVSRSLASAPPGHPDVTSPPTAGSVAPMTREAVR